MSKPFSMIRAIRALAGLITVVLLSVTLAPGQAEKSHWYSKSFYLLHEDYHTGAAAEVGRDANPAEVERLINLSRPDSIQIHAKGNPGWTTYPSKIGHVPPKIARDVLGIWRDIARRNGYHWSIYYNIGRDGEIMKRHPEWNRSKQDGSEVERALCYHSGVAEKYLWPMLREITAGYEPDGFWFDGSVFTIEACYCDACRKRFKNETGMDLPAAPSQPGWAEFLAMQRQIYREFVHRTCKVVHSLRPDCLITFNWACSVRMPEKPDPGIAYLTGDIANKVEDLSVEAHWCDSVGIPFELMTTGYTFVQTSGGQVKKIPKPKPQIEQEMAIIAANGGRFNLWDTPTATGGLDPALFESYGKVVSPFLRARQSWCLGSKRLPDVSMLHSAAPHYSLGVLTRQAFNKADNRLEGAAELLSRLHLNYELVGDWRLHDRDVRAPLLIVEHPTTLTGQTVSDLVRLIEAGGNVLLTGTGIEVDKRMLPVFGLSEASSIQKPEALAAKTKDRNDRFERPLSRVKTDEAKTLLSVTDTEGKKWPLLTAHSCGKGMAYYLSVPLLTRLGKQQPPLDLVDDVLATLLPPDQRRVTTDAPEHVEIVLREKDGNLVLHMVNMAEGERMYAPKLRSYQPVTIRRLPPVPPCGVTLRVPRKPQAVFVQPGNIKIGDWRYVNGRVELRAPPFDVHQMIVVQTKDGRPGRESQ